jgi:SAM-dependent methyltransferase
MEDAISLVTSNRTAFAREDVVKFYLNADELMPAEQILLDRLAPRLQNGSLLDLGVGGGRTTPHLLALSSDYTGLDYVPEYVLAMQQRYPAARFICGDACSLDGLEDNSFDFVLFSYNGIDCVSHEGRLGVLRSVHRVLKPGGTFMFSSHNRDYEYFNMKPWQRKIVFSRSYLIFMLHCLYHLPRHYRMKRLEAYTDDYAIVNDGDHRFSLLLYYISISKQVEQLTAAGFTDIEAFDQQGQPVRTDTTSHWVHYLARKA